jgi:hypothetical protein
MILLITQVARTRSVRQCIPLLTRDAKFFFDSRDREPRIIFALGPNSESRGTQLIPDAVSNSSTVFYWLRGSFCRFALTQLPSRLLFPPSA